MPWKPKKNNPPRPPKPPDRIQNIPPIKGNSDKAYVKAHWRYNYDTGKWEWVEGHWRK